ncbi:MAG: sulfatase [Armatimonadetes bacterium]|nr:sulfatase [Armatimonadota bacterium]
MPASTSRRTFLTAAAALGVGAFARAEPARRPNVLFIAIDDLRDWVGYLGHNPQTRTPNLDRLARRGVWFTRPYCPAPVCNASRAALMSGLRPSTTGVYENDNDWRRVIAPEKTLPTAFRGAGYHVCGSGKIYHEAYNRRSEWDDYLASEGTTPAPPANPGVGGIRFGAVDCRDEDLPDSRIVDYGINQLRTRHDKPLFLAVGLHKPHMPWYVPRRWFDLHPLTDIQLPPHRDDDLNDVPAAGVALARPNGDHAKMVASGRWKEAVQAYLATISYSDYQVGRLLDAFDQSAYRDNTIICFWSDHGWHLGEKLHWRKFALWEEATRAPHIWVVPGLARPDQHCHRTVDLMGIYPTLCDLCDIQTPAHVEGVSLRPLLADPTAAWDRPAVTTYQYRNHAVRNESWRYIRYANGDEELYDETADPNEWTNLAGRAELAPRKAELARWLPKTDARDIGGRQGQGAE